MRWVASSMSMPSASKKRMTTDCGSSGDQAHGDAALGAPVRTWKRVTGTVATSRSSTFTPAALRPAIIARL